MSLEEFFSLGFAFHLIIDRILRVLISTQARHEPDIRPKCHFVHPPVASIDAPATISAQVSGLDARARSFDPFMSDLPCASRQ